MAFSRSVRQYGHKRLFRVELFCVSVVGDAPLGGFKVAIDPQDDVIRAFKVNGLGGYVSVPLTVMLTLSVLLRCGAIASNTRNKSPNWTQRGVWEWR